MVKFENVKLSKSLGKLGGSTGVGVSVKINAEVLSAEYEKGDDGKFKQSKNGNKRIQLNCKVEKDFAKDDGSVVKIPTFFNVTFYETDFSPKLKDIKPTDKLKKFVEVKYNTGGLGKDGNPVFGNFKVRNYEGQDGSPKSAISIFGGNIQQAIKKDGAYIINDFDGKPMTFNVNPEIEVSLKGFIKPVTDTETFIAQNYNEKAKTLKFDMYYMENDNEYDLIMPMKLKNIEKEKVFKFIEFIKTNSDRVVGVKGKVEKSAIYGETEDSGSDGFGEYSYGGFDIIGYEASVVVDFDTEKNNWVIMKTTNTGKLVLEDDSFNVPKDDDFVF